MQFPEKIKVFLDNLKNKVYSDQRVEKYISLHNEFYENIFSDNISKISEQMIEIWKSLDKKNKILIKNKLKLKEISEYKND